MRISLFAAAILLVLLAFYLGASDNQVYTKAELTVEQVYNKIKTDSTVFLLDVRTEAEFYGDLGHVPGSVLINLSELGARLEELRAYNDRDIVVICRSSNRSGYATRLLRKNGFNAFNMLGGMYAWNAMINNPQMDIERNRNEAAAK
jgi:rhodanese-related sulfurtransferase